MSIENEIAGLTQSTTDLLEAVNTKKATLDTAVSNAQTAVTDATSQVALAAAEKVGAQTARDTAESFKDQAYTYSQSAASAVAYQDLTAIAQTKVETARDVFVYDTTKDSDGGAWRQRTQGTSWYNETLNTATRGSRKEFPAVAVIVALSDGDQIRIYDGDDPSLPMWMIITNTLGGAGHTGTKTSVSAINGKVVFGILVQQGLRGLDFVSDTIFGYKESVNAGASGVSPNPISLRNEVVDVNDWSKGYPALVSPDINDVAMTVLPDAPIDPATGLPIPTIAVATDGGVSVIKDDGTVVDSSSTGVDKGVVFVKSKDGADLYVLNTEFADDTRWYPNVSGLTDGFVHTKNFFKNTPVYEKLSSDTLSQQSKNVFDAISERTFAVGMSSDINLVQHSASLDNSGLVAFINSTYNTGWMNGDIKLAALSDTDDTDLVGTELVTNGTFDTDTSGWTSQLGAILTNVNNQLSVESVGNNSLAYQIFPGDLNKQFILNITVVEGTCTVVTAGWSAGTLAVGTHAVVIKAGRRNNKLDIIPPVGGIAVVDNVSVTLAEQDRSVNNNGLQVFGTVTREPVATGADLVAYSGFTPSNYLVQPYNPDLNFGTGDFCIMGWVNSDYASNKHLFAIVDGQGSSWGLNGFIAVKYDSSTSKLQFILAGGMLSTVTPTANTWQHVCLLRKTGVLYAYLDGKLVGSQINTNNLGATTADSKLYLGNGVFNGNVLFNHNSKQALWRVSKTAPTAEQIAKIYRDEKPLFQEGAQATLHGTSDAVTALAYDDSTDLLHVGTSAGRSVFQGLRRVDNTTDAVGTAISASNNLVVEE